MPYRLFIPRWHPTPLNKLMAGHWSKGSKLKKADRELVQIYARLNRTPHATGQRRVSMTIILAPGKRATDPDSVWKSSLDALVHAKLLTDDNRQGVILDPVIYERGDENSWGTMIELEDV